MNEWRAWLIIFLVMIIICVLYVSGMVYLIGKAKQNGEELNIRSTPIIVVY